LPLDSPLPAGNEFAAEVERAYSGLMATAFADAEAGLGGRLLYAGELDAEGRVLIAAANIAGAASLAATLERHTQKQAVSDGIVDFLVNSLDEALRILKNQLRKREPVAVCVGLAPGAVEGEMRERGVAPDILRADVLWQTEEPDGETSSASAIVTWTVATAPARWLPKLDAIALDCLDPDARRARRWLRFAPRYLGRAAKTMRSMRCGHGFTARFVERVRRAVESGEIGAAVEIREREQSGLARENRLEPAIRA